MVKIKILQITLRADIGGGPRHLELLLRELGSQVQNHVACPREPPYWERFRELTDDHGVEVPHRKFTLFALVRLIAYVRSRRIDLIHAHGKGAGVYGRLIAGFTGVPCVLTPHGMHMPSSRGGRLLLYKFYERTTGHWLQEVFYVSEGERSIAARAGLWRSVPSRTIVNGVPSVADAELGRLRDLGNHYLCDYLRPIAICIARANRQKNPEGLLTAARRCPEVSFVVLGISKAEARGRWGGVADPTNVHFMGIQPDPLAWLAASDLYLTTARWEGMPLAVLEAMSVGLAVVAADIPGHDELVSSGKSGFLFPSGDIDQAVARIRILSKDSARAKRMGEEGRRLQCQYFTPKKNASAILAAYEQILGRGNSPSD